MSVSRGTKPPAAGLGRPKGSVNKATKNVREVIARVAEQNAPKINAWLSRVGKRNPAKAMDLYLRMIEYHIPKLSRQEIVKPDEGDSRIIDSSQLTAADREVLRQMLLGPLAPDQPLLEQQPAQTLESMGLNVAQVIDSVEVSTEVRGDEG